MMKSLLEREPVAVITATTAFIQAGITLAVAFGLSLTTEQAAAITTFIVAAGALILVLFVRPQVTPLADPKNSRGEALIPVPVSPSPAGEPGPGALPLAQ